jgi:hypothetical protein
LGKLGFEIVAVEPSDMHLLAQEICGGMPNVRIANSTFEDFDLGAQGKEHTFVSLMSFLPSVYTQLLGTLTLCSLTHIRLFDVISTVCLHPTFGNFDL